MTVYCPRCGAPAIFPSPDENKSCVPCCCIETWDGAEHDLGWSESSEVQRLRYLLPRLLRAMDADDPRDVHWMAYSALSVTQQELEARRAR